MAVVVAVMRPVPAPVDATPAAMVARGGGGCDVVVGCARVKGH